MTSLLDIVKIRESLYDVQKNFDTINSKLSTKREFLKTEIIDRLVLGYEYLNHILQQDVEPFSNKGLTEFLELNYVVHYGHDIDLKFQGHGYIMDNKDQFYKRIKDIKHWYNQHEKSSGWKRAAGVYVRLLSGPQLFIEGNHRTGNLIMDYILLRDDLPPFILNTYNAVKYFEPSNEIKTDINKNNLSDLWLKMPKHKKKFKEFLKEYTDDSYLIK